MTERHDSAENDRHHGHVADTPECWDKCGDPATDPTRHAEYGRGVAAGLERAKELVMGAPVLLHGQRRCDGPGGVPRVADQAVDADGDPNYVHNSYALRDAVLHWIDKALLQIDGQEAPDA